MWEQTSSVSAEQSGKNGQWGNRSLGSRLWRWIDMFMRCLYLVLLSDAVIGFMTDAFLGYLCGLCLPYKILEVLMSTEKSLLLQRPAISQQKECQAGFTSLLKHWSFRASLGYFKQHVTWHGCLLLPGDTHVHSNVKRETRSFWSIPSPLALVCHLVSYQQTVLW